MQRIIVNPPHTDFGRAKSVNIYQHVTAENEDEIELLDSTQPTKLVFPEDGHILLSGTFVKNLVKLLAVPYEAKQTVYQQVSVQVPKLFRSKVTEEMLQKFKKVEWI